MAWNKIDWFRTNVDWYRWMVLNNSWNYIVRYRFLLCLTFVADVDSEVTNCFIRTKVVNRLLTTDQVYLILPPCKGFPFKMSEDNSFKEQPFSRINLKHLGFLERGLRNNLLGATAIWSRPFKSNIDKNSERANVEPSLLNFAVPNPLRYISLQIPIPLQFVRKPNVTTRKYEKFQLLQVDF